MEHLAREICVGSASADRVNGGARSGFRLRDDGADAPAEFAKAMRERAPHASRADDGNSPGHST
jgi:hypothetical protein